MPDQVIRPSLKFIYAGYLLVLLLFVAACVVHVRYFDQQWPLLPLVCAILFIWPAQRNVRRLFTKATLSGDKLRYESGFLSRSTRTLQISKMQSVQVQQSLGQRMVGVGDISLETAGETSRLTIPNVDAPQSVADMLMAAIERSSGAAGAAR